MDKQQIEILGTNLLINQLVAEGIECAKPIRDNGIDLIVHADRRDGKKIKYRPLQIKVLSNEGVSIDEKYSKTAGLIIVFVWHVDRNADVTYYAVTYDELFKVFDAMGYKVKSGHCLNDKVKIRYVTTKPTEKLKDKLEQYKVVSSKWHKRLFN
jgi:hypothetical protein